MLGRGDTGYRAGWLAVQACARALACGWVGGWSSYSPRKPPPPPPPSPSPHPYPCYHSHDYY